MYRIVLPNGKLVTASKVIPMVEASVKMNGSTQNHVDASRGMKYNPTGLYFILESGQGIGLMGNCNPRFTIGNLRPEFVRDAVRRLASQGYFDFSALQCKEVVLLNEAVIDGGLTHPYCLDGYMMSFDDIISPPIGNRVASDEEASNFGGGFSGQCNAEFGSRAFDDDDDDGWDDEDEEGDDWNDYDDYEH